LIWKSFHQGVTTFKYVPALAGVQFVFGAVLLIKDENMVFVVASAGLSCPVRPGPSAAFSVWLEQVNSACCPSGTDQITLFLPTFSMALLGRSFSKLLCARPVVMPEQLGGGGPTRSGQNI